jgi:hypothetical protein
MNRKSGQSMNYTKPLFDPMTHYRIVLRGRVDVDWLQSFDNSTEIRVDQTSQLEDVTVLNIQTDQTGIVGLVRRLHGLGMIILQFEIVSDGGNAAEVKE